MVEESTCGSVTCLYHDKTEYRIDNLEGKAKQLDLCITNMKRQDADVDKQLALVRKELENIRRPIWVILAAVLIKLADWAVSFIPTVAAVANEVVK